MTCLSVKVDKVNDIDKDDKARKKLKCILNAMSFVSKMVVQTSSLLQSICLLSKEVNKNEDKFKQALLKCFHKIKNNSSTNIKACFHYSL